LDPHASHDKVVVFPETVDLVKNPNDKHDAGHALAVCAHASQAPSLT
jgi:hypothetical protein